MSSILTKPTKGFSPSMTGSTTTRIIQSSTKFLLKNSGLSFSDLKKLYSSIGARGVAALLANPPSTSKGIAPRYQVLYNIAENNQPFSRHYLEMRNSCVFVLVEYFRRALSRFELCKSLARRNEYHSQVMNGNSAKRHFNLNSVPVRPFVRLKQGSARPSRARDFLKHPRMRIAILVQGCEKSHPAFDFLETSSTSYPKNFRKHKKDQARPAQQKFSKYVS